MPPRGVARFARSLVPGSPLRQDDEGRSCAERFTLWRDRFGKMAQEAGIEPQ